LKNLASVVSKWTNTTFAVAVGCVGAEPPFAPRPPRAEPALNACNQCYAFVLPVVAALTYVPRFAAGAGQSIFIEKQRVDGVR